MTDLLKTFIKKTSQSHSTYYKPSQKYPANRNSDQRQSYRNSNQNPHNRGHHRNNTRIKEIGEFHSDYTSSCSDQSDVEEEFDTQEPPTSENSKN